MLDAAREAMSFAAARARGAVKANERLSLWELDDDLQVKRVA